MSDTKNINSKEIKTTLSVHPKEEGILSNLRKEYMEGDLEILPSVNQNEISIDGVYAFDNGEGLEVSFFIRNASKAPIRLENVPLIIKNAKGEMLAHQSFDMRELGEVPVEGARPWKVLFNRENVYVEKIKEDDWKIIFSGVAKAKKYKEEKKDIYVNVSFEKLPEQFSDERIDNLEETLDSLAPLKMGEFNISPINLDAEPDGRIIVTAIVRNGSEEAIQIKQMPLILRDTNGMKLAAGYFEMEDFVVNPFYARLINFTFTSEGFMQDGIDLTSWYLEFVK